jgi:predicted secreted protein
MGKQESAIARTHEDQAKRYVVILLDISYNSEGTTVLADLAYFTV